MRVGLDLLAEHAAGSLPIDAVGSHHREQGRPYELFERYDRFDDAVEAYQGRYAKP